jgi:hypothetical protein
LPQRRGLDWGTRNWCREAGVHWQSWAQNGEVCIQSLDPPLAGGARLASCLTWLVNSFARRCRRIYDATGALAFTYTSPRMPRMLASRMMAYSDIAFRDPRLMAERVRRRGGDPAEWRWPAFWLEGSFHDYVIGRDPFPPVGTPRRRLVLLAEERQVFIPGRSAKVAARVRRAWEIGLDAVASVDAAACAALLDEEEHGFLLNMLVLVHSRPGAKARPRPPLEESFRRHEALIGELAPSAQAKALLVAWHALWRLPPAMLWAAPGREPWMRYPAVSFVAAVRPFRSAG